MSSRHALYSAIRSALLPQCFYASHRQLGQSLKTIRKVPAVPHCHCCLQVHVVAMADSSQLFRRSLMFSYKWFVQAGYLWDWLLAAVLVWINFNIPGTYIPAVDRMYFADDPNLRYPSVESWLNEQQKFPVEFGIPLLVVALVQIWRRSGIDL